MSPLPALLATALAAPSSTPPGLDQVCDRYDAAEATGADVTAAALESGRRGVPCDLVAENGVCLYGGARVAAAPGGGLSLVPVERDGTLAPGETGTVTVMTLGHFIDDWQGETAYIKMDDRVSWRLTADDTETDVVVDVTRGDDGGLTLRTTAGGKLTKEAQVEQDMVGALDGNPDLLVVSGTSTDAAGETTSTWTVMVENADGKTMKLTTVALTYTPVVTTFGSCWDNVQNGDEEGVDCGGSACTPCIAD